MKKSLRFGALALALLLAAGVPAALAQLPTPEQLQELLKRFPDADTNHDGVLSPEEALAYAAKMRASRPAQVRATVAPAPTFADVAYGPAPRNRLDFWRAPAASAEHPTPVVVYIHGGGFVAGDKSKARDDRLVQQCLDAGVSFAAINYRYLGGGTAIPDLLRDCARAIQFLRTQSAEWHLDKARIASYGESGGAGASLWLAFHPDLADPKNSDPILRESSRLACVGALSTQFSYDLTRWFAEFGEDLTRRLTTVYTPQLLYGLPSEEALRSPAGEKIRADCDMLGLIAKDAPPVFLISQRGATEATDSSQLLHHPRHAQLLYERGRELGVTVVAEIPAFNIHPPKDGPANLRDFFLAQLNAK